MSWNKPLLVAGSLVVITLCAVSVWRTVRPPPPARPDPTPFRGLGEAAAQQANRLVNGSGRVVVWTYPTTSENRDLVESSLAAFKSTLKELPGMTLQAEERVAAPLTIIRAPGVPNFTEVSTEFPEAEFERVLTKAVGADVVVSFVAPPALSPEQIAALPQPRPKLIVVPLYDLPTGTPVLSDLVQAAIVKRSEYMPQPGEPLPKTPAEWVERYYQIVTSPARE